MARKITVGISDIRYQALHFALKEKGTTIEKEMEEALNRLYEKSVATKVREFTEQWEAQMARDEAQPSPQR